MDQSNQTEAVFKSSRNEVDPVSGNEVPAGALPEEVRDDVPAMLSEGEYVVPADVLRYYGVKFFEDLRNEAKMGLTEMDAGGRIGGEPVEGGDDLPFSHEELMAVDDEEEAPAGFAEGGLNMPSYVNAPDMSGLGLSMGEPTGGVEFRTYVNSNGMEITIPFFDGEPLGAIPAGYSLKSDTTEAAREQVKQDKQERESRSDGPSDRGHNSVEDKSVAPKSAESESGKDGKTARDKVEDVVAKGLVAAVGGAPVALGDKLSGGKVSDAVRGLVETVSDTVFGQDDEGGKVTGKGGFLGTGYTGLGDMVDGGGPGQKGDGGLFGKYTGLGDMVDGGGPGKSGGEDGGGLFGGKSFGETNLGKTLGFGKDDDEKDGDEK